MAKVDKSIDDILNGIKFNEYGFPEGEEPPTYEDLWPEDILADMEKSEREMAEERGEYVESEEAKEFRKSIGFDFENWKREDYIALNEEGELSEEDALKLSNWRNPDDVLPPEIETPQYVKFMYDDYLGKAPFSDKMPKNIYNYIFAMELTRKLSSIPKKMHYKVLLKNKPTAIKAISELHDYTEPNIEIDIEPIQKILKKWSLDLNDTSKFKDLNGTKFIKPPTSDYDICPKNELFSLDDLPRDVSRQDKELAEKLHRAYEEWCNLKPKGYVSDEGLLTLNDFRMVKETDDPMNIRNLFWTTEKDIEYQSHKMMVIKRKAISTTEYNKLNPPNPLDEYPKPNTKKYVEEPHPHDSRYVMIEGKVAHAGVDPTSPYYPQWKSESEHTVDEVWDLEREYANEILSLEEEIKDLKRQFKERRQYYEAQGVQVKAVDRVVRKLKKESKRTPQERNIEDEIYARLSGNAELMRKFNEIAV